MHVKVMNSSKNRVVEEKLHRAWSQWELLRVEQCFMGLVSLCPALLFLLKNENVMFCDDIHRNLVWL